VIKRVYLQWINKYANGEEHPMQLEYSKEELEFIETDYEVMKKCEGKITPEGITLKPGSVRVVGFDSNG
jgi:hypothetical protein